MPIYEYSCQDCETTFEVIRPMGEADSALTCAECHGENVRRRISLFNAASGGRVIAGTSNSCNSCSGGSCSTCGSN